jgi:hypothetical protein
VSNWPQAAALATAMEGREGGGGDQYRGKEGSMCGGILRCLIDKPIVGVHVNM